MTAGCLDRVQRVSHQRVKEKQKICPSSRLEDGSIITSLFSTPFTWDSWSCLVTKIPYSSRSSEVLLHRELFSNHDYYIKETLFSVDRLYSNDLRYLFINRENCAQGIGDITISFCSSRWMTLENSYILISADMKICRIINKKARKNLTHFTNIWETRLLLLFLFHSKRPSSY